MLDHAARYKFHVCMYVCMYLSCLEAGISRDSIEYVTYLENGLLCQQLHQV